MGIDKYLHPKATKKPHPVIRRWEYKRSGANVVKIECEFRRERNGLTFEPAELHVFFVGADGKDAAEPDSELWDSELDNWLLNNKVKALSRENEAARFGFGLADRLSKAESRFGDGYFNAVLRTYLAASELGTLSPLPEILRHIHENRPHPSEALAECQEMIESAISSVGVDLTLRLQYADSEATSILVNAIVYYLDERFNISSRRVMGWL